MSLFKFVSIKEGTWQSDCFIKKGWTLNAVCTEYMSNTIHFPSFHFHKYVNLFLFMWKSTKKIKMISQRRAYMYYKNGTCSIKMDCTNSGKVTYQ